MVLLGGGNWAGILQLVATLAALGAAWMAFRAVRAGELKANLELFLEFSRQYDDLKVGLPQVIDRARSRAMMADELSARHQQALLGLFRLFEKEHYLYRMGVVPPRIWKIWREGMMQYARFVPIREFMTAYKGEFRPAFVKEIMEGK